MSFAAELRKESPHILEVLHWPDQQADFMGPRKTLREYWRRIYGELTSGRLFEELQAVERAAKKARRK